MARTYVTLEDTIASLREKVNEVSFNLGDIASLNTSGDDSDFVQSVNSNAADIVTINDSIGDGGLTTTAQTLVGAHNEHDAELGTISAAAMGTTASTVSGAVKELDSDRDRLVTYTGIPLALTTTATTLGAAVNEHETDIGSMSLNTTASDLTAAINELHDSIGEVGLDTTATSIKAAINEHEADIGNMTLNTTASNLTAAINELHDSIGEVGLDTTANNIKAAINEHETDIGSMSLNTTASDLTAAINELHDSIGEVGLDTTATSIKAAINEHEGDIGNMSLNTTASNLTAAINELHDSIGEVGLTTTAQNIKAAVNELHTEVETLNTKVEPSQGFSNLVATTLSDAVNELAAMSTDSVSEGSTNLYYTNDRVHDTIQVTDAGGLGSFAKTQDGSDRPVLTYTGPSNNDIRGLFSGGTGISIAADGTINGTNATTTTKGVASFATSDFTVSSGAVSIKTGGVANTKLANSSITVNDGAGAYDTISLGDTLKFAGTSGVLTVDYDSAGNQFTFDLADTVAVTTDLSVGSNLSIGGDLTVTGGFTVQGTTSVEAAFQVMLDGVETGNPVSNGGIAIRRGDADSAQFMWDETKDRWRGGLKGNLYDFITTDTVTDSSPKVSNAMLAGSIANSKLSNSSITINGTAVSLGGSRTLDADDIAEAATPTNKYFTNARLHSAITISDSSGHDQFGFQKDADDNLTMTYRGYTAGGGIDISATGTISGENASTSNKGIASFSSTNFSVASGAVSVKTGGIGTTQLAGLSVTGAKIAAGAVDTQQLADGAVDSDKIELLSISAGQIKDQTITGGKIADDTITSAQIAGNAVTASELANNAVDTSAIGNLAVTTGKLADSCVTTAKIDRHAVGNLQLGDTSVDTRNIVGDAVTSAKIADNAVGQEHLQDDAVGQAELKSAVTLVIYSSDETALKTIYGAGA